MRAFIPMAARANKVAEEVGSPLQGTRGAVSVKRPGQCTAGQASQAPYGRPAKTSVAHHLGRNNADSTGSNTAVTAM